MPNPPKYHKHPRLPGNDYTRGAYFVTLCALDRRQWFGRIVGMDDDAVMEPNDLGRIVFWINGTRCQRISHICV